jgi:hypothetical protein
MSNMAMCERCKTSGYAPAQMHASLDGKELLGPCCQKSLPEPEPELDWGLQLSSKKGLQVYAQFGDLKLSFNKSFDELKELVDRIQ